MVRPVLYPAWRRMDAVRVATVPLPLVPAMCTHFSPDSGLPRRAMRACIRVRLAPEPMRGKL